MPGHGFERLGLLGALALAACGGDVTSNGSPGVGAPPSQILDASPDRGGGRSTDHVPARDPEVAVREEYEAARQADTAEAYRLFARRHPEHPLAADALRRAEALEAGR